MVDVLIYLMIGALMLGGLLALARPRRMTDEEYEQMKGKTSMVGNAMQGLQDVFESQKAEALRKARTELARPAEDPGGDPPDPDRDRPRRTSPS